MTADVANAVPDTETGEAAEATDDTATLPALGNVDEDDEQTITVDASSRASARPARRGDDTESQDAETQDVEALWRDRDGDTQDVQAPVTKGAGGDDDAGDTQDIQTLLKGRGEDAEDAQDTQDVESLATGLGGEADGDGDDARDTQDVGSLWKGRDEDEEDSAETTLIQGFAPIRVGTEPGGANGGKTGAGSGKAGKPGAEAPQEDSGTGSGEQSAGDPGGTRYFAKADATGKPAKDKTSGRDGESGGERPTATPAGKAAGTRPADPAPADEDDEPDPDSTATISKADIQAALAAADRADKAAKAAKDKTTTRSGETGGKRPTATPAGKAAGTRPADPAPADEDDEPDPDSTATISKADIQAALAAADRADKAAKDKTTTRSGGTGGKRPTATPAGKAAGTRPAEPTPADEADEPDADSTAVIPKIVLPDADKGRVGPSASRVKSFPVLKEPGAPATEDGSEENELDRTPATPRPISPRFAKNAAAPPAAEPKSPPAKPAKETSSPAEGLRTRPGAEPAAPSRAEPGTSRPGTGRPGTTKPGTTKPGTTKPGTAKPGTAKPGTAKPGTARPGTAEPGTAEPGSSRPGPSTPGSAVPADLEPARTGWRRGPGDADQAPAPTTVAAAVAAPEARPAAKPKPEAKPGQEQRLGRVATWLPPLLTLEGLIMYVLSLKVAPGFLRGVELEKINGLGLVSVLPGAALASIALLIVAFFITLVQNLDRKGVLLFQLAAITFSLHGAAALVEDEPRFHTAWVHAGFAEYIGRAGEAIPGLDARFSWPGFFSLFGFLTRAADVADYAPILKWWPLAMNLLYLVPFVLILRQIVATTRARWFAALLFIVVQWIGQDYFSPQGFTYLWYLTFVAIVLRWFGKVEHRTGPLPPKGFIRRTLARLDRLTPGELPPQATDRRDKLIMLMLMIGLFTATTATHQVTPFMMLGALTGLILLRRTTLTLALPVFLGMIVVAWLSYQATPYWSGHFNELFGGIGRIFDNLQENTGDRLVGTDPEHAIVLQVRLGILAVILLLAAIGLLRRLHRGVVDRVAVVLLCIPVLALGLQSYGGEIGLRVYLFAIPGTCILAAYAFFPNPQLSVDAPEIRPQRVPRLDFLPKLNPTFARNASITLAAVTALTLAGAFLIARYGNEKFERVSADEAAAMHYIYEHDKPSARALYLVPELNLEITPTIPWRERDIDVVEYREALAPRDPTQINHLITQLRTLGPQTYLIATRGQAAYLELAHGYPADWGERFRAALNASRQLKVVFDRPDAAVYVLRSYPRGTEVPPPAPFQLVGDRPTPWTPYGLAALGVTWIGLFGYEALRLGGVERGRKARRRFLMVAIPAVFVALAVVVERFIVLGFDPMQQ